MTITPTKDWQAHYGPDVIRKHCGHINDYVVLTSPSAWQAVRPQMAYEPRDLAYVTSQEEEFNQSVLTKLPKATHVLGVGGGMAIDAAKVIAAETQADLILVPTIVSSGAIFQPHFPGRRNGRCIVLFDLIAPQQVLFDTDIIHAAPPHLNASGMAECICWLGVVASWKWWCEQNLPGSPWDQSVANEVFNWVESRVQQYTADLDADGRPGPMAIRYSAEVNRERFELKVWKLKTGHALDHLFDNTFVWVHKRSLLHGEAVALGALITCLLYGSDFDRCKALLDACGTRYRPSQIGCTWSEVRSTLDAIPENADHLENLETYLHHRTLDNVTFQSLVDQIDPG